MLQEFIERVHYPECPYVNAENKYISYPEEIERCEFENSDTCRARHSCKEYTEDKYSGRRCLVKIKEIFDISFIAPNYIAFTFDIVRKNC